MKFYHKGRLWGLNIKNDDTHRLAIKLAQLTGETLTRTVTIALQERLAREQRRRHRTGGAAALRQIGRRCASRPVLDDQSSADHEGCPGRTPRYGPHPLDLCLARAPLTGHAHP